MSGSGSETETDQGYELFDPNAKKEARAGLGFMQFGAVAGLAGLGYMARNFKNKNKDMKISVYVIHTRMLAQGTVIGVLCLGMFSQMYKRYQDKQTDG
ncbi:HIG1 domain family member 1A, mitochondrial isoform X2 [Eurytemora carolleeae]|nr:HIG1 domain family member 1A, mitochondrial isoform X2 [Eurytemora carolleeae]|eukprot:XP_023334341.1 HIG1 domain family member 1A, mitochondrial-like isoform X2 [Eurytemora affinis]